MGRLVQKKLGGTLVSGFSLAGEESVVAAPEYNVCFDIGRAPREVISIDNVCLTHGHMDHAAGVAYYFSQRCFIGNSPGRVIVHRSLAQSIQKLMDVWADIEGHPSAGQVYGVEHLEDVPIRRGLIVRPFTVNHTGSSLGFTIVDVRHRLKEELQGKLGPELVALKKQGVEIEDHVEIPVLTYPGDTAPGRFLDLDFVRKSRAVLLECTFFEDDHRVRAQAGRHIHVDQLPRVLAAVPDAEVMLIHLTRRTDLRAAKHQLRSVLTPSDLERVSFLMDRPRRLPPGHRPDGVETLNAKTPHAASRGIIYSKNANIVEIFARTGTAAKRSPMPRRPPKTKNLAVIGLRSVGERSKRPRFWSGWMYARKARSFVALLAFVDPAWKRWFGECSLARIARVFVRPSHQLGSVANGAEAFSADAWRSAYYVYFRECPSGAGG